MRDARTPNGIWVKDAQVYVEPASAEDDTTRKNIAVLEVHPRNKPFYIGWRTEQFAEAEFYSEVALTENAMMAMGVGEQPVYFIARSCDGTRLVIELVELTTEDDPKYATLPRY